MGQMGGRDFFTDEEKLYMMFFYPSTLEIQAVRVDAFMIRPGGLRINQKAMAAFLVVRGGHGLEGSIGGETQPRNRIFYDSIRVESTVGP